MNTNNYKFIGISVIAIILLYLYWKYNHKSIENFRQIFENNYITNQPLDAIGCLPDPLVNPVKLVVVMTRDNYVWKFDFISQPFEELEDSQQKMLGLKLIEGYPRLTSEEWPTIDNYFQTDLTGFLHEYDVGLTYFIKHRYRQPVSHITGRHWIRMTGAYPFDHTENINMNRGYDSIIASPDISLPLLTQRKQYITNEFPKIHKVNNQPMITNKTYTNVLSVAKDNDIYALKMFDEAGNDKIQNWVSATDYNTAKNNNVHRIKLIGYGDHAGPEGESKLKSQGLQNYQGFIHWGLGTDRYSIYNRCYTNDLYNTVVTRATGISKVSRCRLWHIIKRSPRCTLTYPLINSRQEPSHVYVFGNTMIWKYRPLTSDANHLMALISGYPKLITEEISDLPVGYRSHFDGVWAYGDYYYIAKNNKVLRYNFKNNRSINTINIGNLIPELEDSPYDAIVQVYENNKHQLYIYYNNKYLQYEINGSLYTRIKNWTNVPSNQDKSDDFLIAGIYHPLSNKQVITHMKESLVDNENSKNELIYHGYTKNTFLSDPIAGGYFIIQQSNQGIVNVLGLQWQNGKLVRKPIDTRYWQPIKDKNIMDINGMIITKKFNIDTRNVFAGTKYYNFRSTGNYNTKNYIHAFWSNQYDIEGRDPTNFPVESITIPSNFDFCFDDNDKYAWFFKYGICYKFNFETRNIETHGPQQNYFPNLPITTEGAFYDWTEQRIYFVHGNMYTLYRYNATRSTKMQDATQLFDLLGNDEAQEIANNFIMFAPSYESYSRSYGIEEGTINVDSMHNYIQNGNFQDITNTDNLGNVNIHSEIIDSESIVGDMPFNGKALKYTTNGGKIVDLTLPELYVSDIVFSFYVKRERGSPEFNINIITTSETSNQINVTVGEVWRRVTLYQWHDFDFPFKIEVNVPMGDQKIFYVSGFQLENNMVSLPFFTGKVFHTWDDASPPEIAYLYNLNYLSTIPSQTERLEIEVLMSYNTLNQERTPDNIGFKHEQAAHFDGQNVFMVIPTMALQSTTLDNFSFSTWVRFRNFASSPKYQSIAGIWKNETEYLLIQESDGLITVRIKTSTHTFGHTFQTVKLAAFKWYFLAMTIHNGSIRLYAYNYYEEVAVPGTILDMNINNRMMIGIPADYSQIRYKDYMLHADVGGISIWRRQLSPQDIKILSKTYKDVKLALPEIKRHQLVSSGLDLPLLLINITSVDGLGMCTYNANINWKKPKIPLDYMKLGFMITEYETKLEYYIGGNLIAHANLDTHIASEEITADVKNIRTFKPQTQCRDCKLQLVNIPHEYNYRFYIRYKLSNGEQSEWTDMELRFKDNLVKVFDIKQDLACQYKTYAISIQNKLKGEKKQNKFIEMTQTRISNLKRS
jgi:hypothetical protein